MLLLLSLTMFPSTNIIITPHHSRCRGRHHNNKISNLNNLSNHLKQEQKTAHTARVCMQKAISVSVVIWSIRKKIASKMLASRRWKWWQQWQSHTTNNNAKLEKNYSPKSMWIVSCCAGNVYTFCHLECLSLVVLNENRVPALRAPISWLDRCSDFFTNTHYEIMNAHFFSDPKLGLNLLLLLLFS